VPNDSSGSDTDDDVSGQALVARELRRHRERAGLSRGELARRVGYSRTYISTSEKPGADLVSEAVVTRIDQELGAHGALIAVHARAAAGRRARRSLAERELIPPAPGAAHLRTVGPQVEPEEVERVKRGEFLQLAAATVVAAAMPRGLAGLLADPPAGGDVNAWAAGVHDAVLNPTGQAGRWLAAAPASPPLRAAIDSAMTASLTAGYHTLDTTLPRLIGRAEAQALVSPEDEGANRDLADVYAVAGWVLIKADLPLTAWIAAHRAVRAAERAVDPVRVAAATRCLAEVHMRNGNHEKAAHTALLAAVALDGTATNPAEADLANSVRGAALLSAAAASARRGERGEARASLAAASRCADRLGRDTFDLATVFGPTNVAIHRVAVAVELGDASDAVHLADDVRLDALPAMLGERRSRYLLDVARAHAAVGDARSATQSLLHAESISADEVRHHRITRRLVPTLITLEHGDAGLRGLARRSRIPL
jgi:transcriptional regulator with XRE-family HTH domain